MTHDDKEFLKEFIRGAFVTIVLVGFFILFVVLLGTSAPESSRVLEFKVVDQYKNCDVVRYIDPSQRYRYFLHCPKAP